MKVGLEVHQQLATGKLFCACPCELSEVVSGRLIRRLRPTGGEDRSVDPAVAFEAARGLSFHYETTPSDCLVESDEEPPHAINPAALEVALTVALLLRARPLDEIEVMRKIVIDGSNTAGFQRTCLVAVDGVLEVGERRYTIPTICLEEDAARKVEEGAGATVFRLDRLGIPLIEIATGPEITEGAEARAVAEEIGTLLRATRAVRRGIGTIREDLNVSTPGGTRIEIKGVQELRLIERYVAVEGERQARLLAVRDALAARAPDPPPDTAVDVAAELGEVRTGPLAGALRRRHPIFGLRLPGFAGLLGPERPDGERLGRELADRARAAGLGGLLHSDELPGHGLEPGVVERVRSALGCEPTDGFVILAAPDASTAERAVRAIRARVLVAFEGVPPETRDPLPDGRTRYSRPLPGRDRMYPETDVPPVRLDRATIAERAAELPELPRISRERLARTHGVAAERIAQLQREDALDRFERLVGRGFPPSAVARLLTQDLPEAEEGLSTPVRELTEEEIESVLRGVHEGRYAKEAIPPLLRRLLTEGGNVEAAAEAAGLAPLSREELERLAETLVAGQEELLRAKGERAISPLMGDLMREVRGRRDGREVAEVLERAVRRRLEAIGGR